MSNYEKLKKMRKYIHLHPVYQDVYQYDRDLWELFLTNLFGVSSTVELSEEQLKHLNHHLNNKATVEQKKRFMGYRKYESKKVTKKAKIKVEKATKKQVDFIEYLWVKNSREKTSMALRYFIKKTIDRLLFEGSQKNKEYEFLNLLTRAEASKVITGIKKL